MESANSWLLIVDAESLLRPIVWFLTVRTLQCESPKAVPNETVMHLSDHPTIGASSQSAGCRLETET